MNVKSKTLLLFLLLLVAVVPLFSVGLSNHGLWTPDEPRVAEIGREMAVSGNWAVPSLNRKPFLEHPPLHYAAIALAIKGFGVSEWAARLPSAVFALAGIFVVFLLAIRQFGPRIGFISAFVLATVFEYFRVGNWAVVDSALALSIFLALTCFWVAYSTTNRWKRVVFYGSCYTFCTLAFYAKGFIGIVLPGVAVLAFLVFDRNIKEVLRMHLWLGILIFGAMTLPWFLSLWRQGGVEFLKVFLLHNHLERFAGGSTGHNQPFYYYLVQFPGGFLPWSLLIVPAVAWLPGRRGQVEDSQKKALLFAECWFISGFILLSMASTKRILYLMPLFAPASILIGFYIDSTLNRSAIKWFERLFGYIFGLVPLAIGLSAVPLFLYASKEYGILADSNAIIRVVCFSFLMALLAFLGLRNFKRDKMRFWFLSGASLVSLFLFTLVVAIPLLDQKKSFVPFCREVASKAPAASKLYAYKPDETIRGAIPFYTGRYVNEAETLPSLKDAVLQEGCLFVVVRDSRDRLKKEIESAGPFSLLSGQRMGLHGSLALYAMTPSSSEKKECETTGK